MRVPNIAVQIIGQAFPLPFSTFRQHRLYRATRKNLIEIRLWLYRASPYRGDGNSATVGRDSVEPMMQSQFAAFSLRLFA